MTVIVRARRVRARDHLHGCRLRAALLSLAVALAPGCAAPLTGKHGISDQAPSGAELKQMQDESAPYRKRGSGVVTGRVTVHTPDGVIVARAGSRVLLLPATAYASPRFALFVVAEGHVAPALRAAAIAQSDTDALGGFRFEKLPPGSYLIASEVFWTAADGAPHGAVPFARVDLADGAAVEVAVTRAAS